MAGLPPHLRDRLQELLVLYAKTKGYVLLAEERDPASKSNIAIFKEHRDALDHLMRAAVQFYRIDNPEEWDVLEDTRALVDEPGDQPSAADDPEEYILTQFSKARGHIFRAAYDALDGMGISLKYRIAEAVKGASNEALKEVYPSYWEHRSRLARMEKTIAQHRADKDIGTNSTLENLEAYAQDLQRIAEMAEEAQSHANGLVDFGKKQRASKIKWLIIVPIIIGVTVGITMKVWDKLMPAETPKLPTPNTTK